MLVCHCFGQSDRAICQEIAAGATDEDEIGAVTGAGTNCGGCLPELRKLLDKMASEKLPAGVK